MQRIEIDLVNTVHVMLCYVIHVGGLRRMGLRFSCMLGEECNRNYMR